MDTIFKLSKVELWYGRIESNQAFISCINFLMYFFKVFCKYHLKLRHAILVLGCIFCHVYVFVKFTTTDIKLHFALWARARREKKRLFLDENLEEKELRSVLKKIVHIIPGLHRKTKSKNHTFLEVKHYQRKFSLATFIAMPKVSGGE